MKNDKYEDLDKQISKEIMQEVKGKIIEHTCPHCKAEPEFIKECQDCNGEGKYSIQY